MEELVIIRRKIVRRQISKDLINRWQVIQHLRDLANIGEMLEGGCSEQLALYRRRLRSIGWSLKEIHKMEEIAYSRTNWEVHLPHIHSKGSDGDWLGNKHRWK